LMGRAGGDGTVLTFFRPSTTSVVSAQFGSLRVRAAMARTDGAGRNGGVGVVVGGADHWADLDLDLDFDG
jgi:hypothetical protein